MGMTDIGMTQLGMTSLGLAGLGMTKKRSAAQAAGLGYCHLSVN